MGFDVLAFESGMYSARKAWQELQSGENPQRAFGLGIFAIWAGSAEVQPLIAYLAEMAGTERPLELAGFDSQIHSAATRASLVHELETFLRSERAPILRDTAWSTTGRILSALTEHSSGIGERPPPHEQAVFLSTFEELQRWLTDVRASNDREKRFWLQLVTSVSAHVRGSWARDPDYWGIDAGNYRDEQMADNLLWLVNDRYQGRKIIVWAATFHNLRNPSAIQSGQPDLDYALFMPMGHHLWEALGNAVYNIGFTAYEGEARVWYQESAVTVPPATQGSLEDLLVRTGLENALIDFRGAGPSGQWLSQPLLARLVGWQEMEADWTSVFDGVFFTRTMAQSTPADPK
jgi:erythromycin esterase